MSLLSLQNVTLTIANNVLLDSVDWHIEPNERITLVGRNGAGKSTLLKLIAGKDTTCQGKINKLSNLKIASLEQEVPLEGEESVYHYLVKGLDDVGELLTQYRHALTHNDLNALEKLQVQMDDQQAWDILPQIEAMADKLQINLDSRLCDMSGGMKRRTLLTQALLQKPDLLLLDEPTNHLDLPSIEWLESWLKAWNGSLLMVTHDRVFLKKISTRIVEIDRGKLYSYPGDYDNFLVRQEERINAEVKQNALFDKKLQIEEDWIRTGIKARRTRNEGRVRTLEKMRKNRQDRRNKMGEMQSVNLQGKKSGNIVLEAEHVSYDIDDKNIINNFSTLLTRGDKIGILGPNGCGKTTLVKLLLQEIKPSSGSIRHGTQLNIAFFDQLRTNLNDDETLLQAVAEGSDYVTINGQNKHVASYLKDFLFSPEKFNQRVKTLSGGERNRLLLAKLFAKPINFLVMDEPTNDLDLETLELLEYMLVEYPGTLMLISHDREFLNRVVTSILVWEGDGTFNDYVGGFDDYVIQKKQQESKPAKVTPIEKPDQTGQKKLSYNEQRELDQLPKKLEALEATIAKMHEQMTQPDFYQQPQEEVTKFSQKLKNFDDELSELYTRWESLEERR